MKSNNVTYVDPDHTWTTRGTLKRNLYYEDNLHLTEKGNDAKAISTTLNVWGMGRGLKTSAKSSTNWPTASTRTPTSSAHTSPPPTTRKSAASRRAPKTPKRTLKTKTKYQQHQKERQQPQEEIHKHHDRRTATSVTTQTT